MKVLLINNLDGPRNENRNRPRFSSLSFLSDMDSDSFDHLAGKQDTLEIKKINQLFMIQKIYLVPLILFASSLCMKI